MASIAVQDSQALLASIHAGARRVLLKMNELEPEEAHPIQLILNKTQYALSRKTLLELGYQVSLLKDTTIQGIWNRIFSDPLSSKQSVVELLRATESNGLAYPNKVAGTDLTVYVDHYQGSLPINGIKERDYVDFSHLIRSIEEEKTNFVFDCTPAEKRELIQYFWQIGARDLGRELLRYMTSFPHPIILRRGAESLTFSDRQDPSIQVVVVSLQPKASIVQLVDGTLRSELAPIWLDVAHELIHIRHKFDGTFTEEVDKLLSRRFESGEEQRTITGIYKNLLFDWQHENAYRLLNDRNLRINHEEGISPGQSAAEKIIVAIQLGLLANVKEILEKEAQQLDLEELEFCISFAEQENKLEIAALLALATQNYLPPLEKG